VENVELSAREALGYAIASRREEFARLLDDGPRLRQHYPDWFIERRRLARNVSLLLLVRWLITGLTASDDELAWTRQLGQLAANEGYPLADLTKGFLAFRDTFLNVLREESDRLGTPEQVVSEAARMAVAASDGAIVQMQRAFDRQMQELLAVKAESEARNRFLATVSHELRTPLNSMMGFAELLRVSAGPGHDPRQARYLQNIETSAKQLLALIDDVLDLTKVRSGRMGVSPQPLLLDDLVEAAVEQHRPLLAAGVELRVGPPARVWAEADPVRLRQVLGNLLSNAIKFTRAGHVAVCVGREGDWAEVTISDTGVGIPAEHLAKVFEEFFRVEDLEIRTTEGTGLGLTLAKEFTELMDGELLIESEPGRGTTLRVRLPALEVASRLPIKS
jgi:signal transduction histidine kinase